MGSLGYLWECRFPFLDVLKASPADSLNFSNFLLQVLLFQLIIKLLVIFFGDILFDLSPNCAQLLTIFDATLLVLLQDMAHILLNLPLLVNTSHFKHGPFYHLQNSLLVIITLTLTLLKFLLILRYLLIL